MAERTHYHVMNLDESRMWRQPIRPLREWFQEDLIARVQALASDAGFKRAAIFDPEENLQWRTPSDELRTDKE